MKRSSTMNWRFTWAPWLLSIAALAGCEESTQVGSGCVEGFCPQALSRTDDACVLTAAVAEIAYTPSPAGADPLVICLPQALPRSDDGTVQAHVYYFIAPSEESIRCTDRPYLKPVSEAIRDQYLEDEYVVEVCELNQLAVITPDGGEPSVAAGDGFYYDDFSDALELECTTGTAGRVVITTGALSSPMTTVHLDTSALRTADGDIDPELVCEPLRGSEPVGTPCDPMQDSYNDSQVVLATRSEACGDGVCLAYHWDGPEDPSCESPDAGGCPAPRGMEERVYCSCRCDGPPGADLCECPEAFSCVEVISEEVNPDLAGSYCVKNGSYAE